jgi:hypothetical protein
VTVRLRDKTKLKGYVEAINPDDFVIVDDKTGSATSIAYSQVRQIRGRNSLTGEQIALAIVVIAILIILATSL